MSHGDKFTSRHSTEALPATGPAPSVLRRKLTACVWPVADLLRVDSGSHDMLLERRTLIHSAANDTEERVAKPPDCESKLMQVNIGALDAHNAIGNRTLPPKPVLHRSLDGRRNCARGYKTLWAAEQGASV